MNRFPNIDRAAEACGAFILEKLNEAIAQRGRATLAISGGSSPRAMFEFFARAQAEKMADWQKIQLFWVDERGVPPTDPQSNFKLANDHWLAPAKYPVANLHRIHAELDAAEAARKYTDEIRSTFGVVPGDVPVFDVIHQGMGPDAHTASLFPGEPLIDDRRGIAAAVWVEKMHQWRITMLPAVLLAARHTVMLVAGADKAGILKEVLEGPYEPKKYPVQLVARNAIDVSWFIDF
ncbi:MAG: 6-phosphogluconolactonase [Acidobacteriia bacterium]|nr:6-phosphogluconolactonase [Terriglobia bacterium]